MEGLHGWRARHYRQKVVATNGCFDILHTGHVDYLAQAQRMGDLLIVGVNSDSSVKALKGEQRPFVTEQDRAEMLLSLRWVDAVCIFNELRAAEFLRQCRPDVYVKGGDYDMESMDGSEKFILDRIGAEVRFVPLLPGKSTSLFVKHLLKVTRGSAMEGE